MVVLPDLDHVLDGASRGGDIGPNLLVSWVDASNVLRTIVLDSSFTRIGESSVAVGAESQLWAGETSAALASS